MDTRRKIHLRHYNLEVFMTPCPNDRKPCKGYKNLRDRKKYNPTNSLIYMYTYTH